MGLAFGLAYAGFAALCLAMARHARQVALSPGAAARWGLRGAGCVLLGASGSVCVLQAGWGGGLVNWAGVLTAAALPLVAGLAVWPRAAVLAGPVLALLCGAAAAGWAG